MPCLESHATGLEQRLSSSFMAAGHSFSSLSKWRAEPDIPGVLLLLKNLETAVKGGISSHSPLCLSQNNGSLCQRKQGRASFCGPLSMAQENKHMSNEKSYAVNARISYHSSFVWRGIARHFGCRFASGVRKVEIKRAKTCVSHEETPAS